MLISIGHVTRYAYSDPVRYSIMALRLTPPDFQAQRVLNWQVSAPGIETAQKFRDGFGNVVHLATATTAHSDAVVIAKGTVETKDMAGIARGLYEPAPVRVYLRETAATKPNEQIKALAADSGAGNNLEGMHRLMHAVRGAVDYRIGATHAHTTAAEAMADGQGVCQDHAQVFISAARFLGVPARYVNGYLLADSSEPAEAAHAWAEVFIDGLGWVGFDPANELCPTDTYVRLATGLDAASAAPIRGSRQGIAHEDLDVIVEVQQQNAQQ